MRLIFWSFLLFLCFCVLGDPLCRNSIVELYGQVKTAVKGGRDGWRDLAVLNRVSKSLLQKYNQNSDQFLNVFQENINSEDVLERRAVLNVIKYMKDPPLKIQRLVMERLEDPYTSIREAAYRTLMAFEIRDSGILQKLEAKRIDGEPVEQIWAERVLKIQENKARLRRNKVRGSKDSS